MLVMSVAEIEAPGQGQAEGLNSEAVITGKIGAARKRAMRAAEAAERLRVEALPREDEDELTAMRWVMNSPEDRTYQHWSLRQIWKTSPEEFRKEYFALVRAERKSRPVSVSPGGGADCSTGPETTSTSAESTSLGAPLSEDLAEELSLFAEYRRFREEFREWKELHRP